MRRPAPPDRVPGYLHQGILVPGPGTRDLGWIELITRSPLFRDESFYRLKPLSETGPDLGRNRIERSIDRQTGPPGVSDTGEPTAFQRWSGS